MVEQQISQAEVREWGTISDVKEILGCSYATAWRQLQVWQAAGKIGKLRGKFHLTTVRELAIAASFEGNS